MYAPILGIALVDKQHQSLFELLERLSQQAATDTFTVEDLLGTRVEVIDYFTTHFSFEESLMRDSNYPGLSEHCALHVAFIARISGFFEDSASTPRYKSFDLVLALNAWFRNHIEKTDRAFVEYYLNKEAWQSGLMHRS